MPLFGRKEWILSENAAKQRNGRQQWSEMQCAAYFRPDLAQIAWFLRKFHRFGP